MSDIVSFEVQREPGLLFGLNVLDKGIHLESIHQNKDQSGKRNPVEIALPVAMDRVFGDFTAIPKELLTKAPKALGSLFDKTYHELQKATSVQDAYGVDKIALNVLSKNEILPFARLPADIQRIFQFFNAVGCKATAEELDRFLGGFGTEQLEDFVKHAAARIDTLQAQILATMANGTLGSTPYNLIDMMKYLMAFQVAALWHLGGGISKDRPAPTALICHIIEAPVFLPHFLFFDPCEWDNDGDATPIGPLTEKVSKKRAYIARVAAKRAASAQKDGDVPVLDDCTCTCEDICLPVDPCCADITYYVADALVLRDQTTCYLPGELAYVENIAPREKRKRIHEFSTRIETYAEEENTTTRTEERDHQVTDRNQVQNEIEKQTAQSLDVQARYGGKKTYVVGDAHLSRETAQTEARETMREAVTRAVTSLQTQKRTLTSRRVTTQESESNAHTFDNRESDQPVVAKYFYVDREVEGQVYSYGLAGTVDIHIPTPSALFDHLQELKEAAAFGMDKPVKPDVTLSTIDPKKHLFYVEKYGLYDLPKPPVQPPVLYEYHTLTAEKPNGGGGKWTFEHPVLVPDGYTASSMKMTSGVLNLSNTIEDRYASAAYGGGFVRKANNKKNGYDDVWGPAVVSGTGAGVIVVTCLAQQTPDLRITLTFTPDTVDSDPWKLAAYKAIMAQYDADMQAYEDALAAHKRAMADKKFGEHPFTLKEIILAELKRAAIFMMCEDFERDAVMNMKSEPCGYPEINRSTASEQLWDQYFWERAFDWEKMSFIFYDYFWNAMCSWSEKFNPDEDNQMFKAFRRAGSAKVTLHCAAGMEEDVIWYLETGQKWGPGGTHPMNPSDPRWISIVSEIKHSKACFQNDRNGGITAILDTSATPPTASNEVLLQGSTLYWDALNNAPDSLGTMAFDLNREIFIAGVRYKIQSIRHVGAGDPLYDPNVDDTAQWIITLERPFEGAALQDANGAVYPAHAHGVGALFVGAPFRWREATSLVWIGDHANACLPCYPVKCD